MSLTRDILSPVTTPALLYPALHQQVIQIAMPNMVARSFLLPYAMTAGNAVTFPKQAGDASAVINEVGEGAEILLDVTPYSAITVVPKKVGHGFVITRETIEDSLLPIQQDQLVRASLRTANKVDKDCIDVLFAGTQGGSSGSATGKSLFFSGTEVGLSGSNGGPALGTYDIIDQAANIEQYNFVPDAILMHPKVKRFVEKLPHFTWALALGEGMLNEGYRAGPGSFGRLYDLEAYASINCPSGSAMLVSRGRNANILAQYSPIGFFVERRPLTTAVKALEERDSLGIYITTRYSPATIQGKALAYVYGINW